MVKNSDKTYGQLILEAQAKTDRQDVGETLEPLLKQLKNIVEEVVQLQAEACNKGGFYLNKYYIHIYIVKDAQAYHGQGAPNVLRIRKPHCRITRPSPYQDEEHYLWSVTNLNDVKFEWCIPNNSDLKYILANHSKFDPSYVKMLRDYVTDKLEKLSDYLVVNKIA